MWSLPQLIYKNFDFEETHKTDFFSGDKIKRADFPTSIEPLGGAGRGRYKIKLEDQDCCSCT